MADSERARQIVFWFGLVVVAIVTLPPFVGDGARGVIMAAFSPVCHQLPGRSPHIGGVSLAVCFRCYGIYWGFPVAAVLFPILHRRLVRIDRRAPLVLAGSLVPAGVDWSLELTGLVQGSVVVRALTGAIFGIAAGYYLVTAIVRTERRPQEDEP